MFRIVFAALLLPLLASAHEAAPSVSAESNYNLSNLFKLDINATFLRETLKYGGFPARQKFVDALHENVLP